MLFVRTSFHFDNNVTGYWTSAENGYWASVLKRVPTRVSAQQRKK
jgi:hypothetical protein